MEKRKWCYAQNPKFFGISCDKCKGSNIQWSEFKHKIWCYDCEIDTDGTGGIFSGPVPIHTSELMGIRFDIIRIRDGLVLEHYVENGHLKYRRKNE